jgi:predicted amidohydrolase
MARKVNMGLVQILPRKWDLDGNWARAKQLLENLDPGETDLIITPECLVDGYAASQAPKDPADGWPDRQRWLRECAIEVDSSQIIGEASKIAGRLGSYLVLGFTQALGDGKAANAAGVFDRDGELIVTYHKTHLQNHDLSFEAGGSLEVIDADFGRFGVLICADRRWPEAMRCLRLMGAEMVANPTYGMHGDLNRAMMRTRAYENGFFIAFAHPQLSMVIGPGGDVEVEEESAVDTFVEHTVDLDHVRDDHVRDRRVDLYRDCLLKG